MISISPRKPRITAWTNKKRDGAARTELGPECVRIKGCYLKKTISKQRRKISPDDVVRAYSVFWIRLMIFVNIPAISRCLAAGSCMRLR